MTRSRLFLCLRPTTNRPSPEPASLPRAGLALVALLVPGVAAAALWNVQPAPEAKGLPWAVVKNAAGHELVLYRSTDSQVHLRFTLAGTFSTLAPGHCPTFQIDAQQPLFHLAIDQACHVDHKHAIVDLGTVEKHLLVSAAIDQLMNGEQIEFRYMTADGRYHEADFALARSSLAIRRALGRDVRVRAK